MSPLLGRGWVLPHWLEKQIDPKSPAFVTGDSEAKNITGRNWTLIGAVGSPERAAVGSRGLVVPLARRPSIDWWIRSNDRWMFPSSERIVHQYLFEDSPVVETVLRIEGGEVVHRAYVAGGLSSEIIIEIENKTPTALAVALAARPYDLESQVRCGEFSFVDGSVLVDGQKLLHVEREPSVVLASNQLGGDVASRLDALETIATRSECEAGLAHGAIVFPLVKGSTLVARIPMGSEDVSSEAVSYEAVARGWALQAESGLRIKVPAGPLDDLVAANIRSLRLFDAAGFVSSDPMNGAGSTRGEMFIVGAMQRYGLLETAGEALLLRCEEAKSDGSFSDVRGELAATGAVLGAIGDQYRFTRDEAFVAAVVPAVIAAASWIEAKRHKRRKDRHPLTKGLMPAGPGTASSGESYRYLDNFWSLRGLNEAAMILDATGDSEAASRARSAAADLRIDLLESMEAVAEQQGSEAIPSGPDRPVDETAIEALSAAWPCAVLRYDHPMIAATVGALQSGSVHECAHLNTIGPRGLGTYRTMRLAMAELGLGDERALARLDWMTKAASPTGTWPDLIYPTTGTGCGGPGHSGLASASFLNFMRELLVSDRWVDGGIELSLLGLMPQAWVGQNIEIHEAPTIAGKFGFALRWHGRRPALLWDLEALDGIGPVTIRVPGLDGDFVSQAHSGETILAPHVQA